MNFFLKSIGLMGALCFFSCTDESAEGFIGNDDSEETGLIPMTFTAIGGNCTKTELQPDNSVYWLPEDSICVFSSSKKEYKFVTDITEKSATATFHGNIEESDSYIAFYPYPKSSDDFLYIDGNVLTFTIPEEQKAINGTFDNSLNPSLAVMSEGNVLKFKNLCSLMKFTFTGDEIGEVRKISIKDNDKVPLSDIVDYNLETGVCNYRYVGGGFPVSIVSDHFEDNGTYYFVLPVFEDALQNGFTLSFYNEEGVEICSKHTSSPVELAPGKIINMGTVEVQKDVDYEIAEDGTYLVYKASGLKAWANNILDYNNTDINKWKIGVRLMRDITFDDNDYWTPVGNTSNGYRGVFDGNGKTIRGLKIGKKGSKDIRNAMFGRLDSPGEIRNLTIDGAVCYGGTYLSVLVSTCQGASVINCHVTNAQLECIFGGATGIICGSLQSGYMEGCTASGNVTGKGVNDVAGLLGECIHSYSFQEEPRIVCCSFEGTVSGDGNDYGGLVGNMGGQMKGCYAVATVTGVKNVGGLAGVVSGYGNSMNVSFFKGSISGNTASAGLLIGTITSTNFPIKYAYYCQESGVVASAVGGSSVYDGFIQIQNNDWTAAIESLNAQMDTKWGYKYEWSEEKQHPVLVSDAGIE